MAQLEKLTGNRVRERGGDMQQMVSRPGAEPRSAAVRTKPMYKGRLLYPVPRLL